MSEQSTNKKRCHRLGSVEIMRFIGMLMIMTHHVYVLGFQGNYPLRLSWVWVDFFFMLTGYYTAKHFADYSSKEGHNLSKTIMMYNINKFKGYFVLTAIAIVLQYFINLFVYRFDMKTAFIVFIKMPYELLFLTSSGVATPELAPVWYLSAVFLMLPLVAYLFIKWRDFWYIISWLLPLLYLGKFGVNTVREWPNDMLRATAYLVLGTFVYLVSEELRKIEVKKIYELLLTALEVGSFVTVVGLTAVNYDNSVIILLFVIGMIIMLSQKSLTRKLSSSFTDFLGKISLPMFLFHWGIGSLINVAVSNTYLKLALYYIGSIAVAAVVAMIIDAIKKRKISKAG